MCEVVFDVISDTEVDRVRFFLQCETSEVTVIGCNKAARFGYCVAGSRECVRERLW